MIQKALHLAKIPPLDAELLLAHILHKPRAWLLAHGENKLTDKQLQQFTALVTRRKNHEPLAYILGEKEFYGRPFRVDPRVLIPRPATEALIDEVKRTYKYTSKFGSQHTTPADTDIVIYTYLKNEFSVLNSQCSILDIGTGSGCIGITLALEHPDIAIIGTDTSEDALDLARENAERHTVFNRMTFRQADLLTAHSLQLTAPFLIVSNPPYIPTNSKLPPDVELFEPHEALFAGPEGMDVLQPLFEQCQSHPRCVGCVLECRREQAEQLRMLRPASAKATAGRQAQHNT